MTNPTDKPTDKPTDSEIAEIREMYSGYIAKSQDHSAIQTLLRALAEAKADNERLREALSSIPCCGECYPGHECSIREIKEQALTGDTHD